jgi:hypothetical protein
MGFRKYVVVIIVATLQWFTLRSQTWIYENPLNLTPIFTSETQSQHLWSIVNIPGYALYEDFTKPLKIDSQIMELSPLTIDDESREFSYFFKHDEANYGIVRGVNSYLNQLSFVSIDEQAVMSKLVSWSSGNNDSVLLYDHFDHLQDRNGNILFAGLSVNYNQSSTLLQQDSYLAKIDLDEMQVSFKNFLDTATGYFASGLVSLDHFDQIAMLQQGLDGGFRHSLNIIRLDSLLDVIDTLKIDSFSHKLGYFKPTPRFNIISSIAALNNTLFISVQLSHIPQELSDPIISENQLLIYEIDDWSLKNITSHSDSSENSAGAMKPFAVVNNNVYHVHIKGANSNLGYEDTLDNAIHLEAFNMEGELEWEKLYDPFGDAYYRVESLISVQDGLVISGTVFDDKRVDPTIDPFYLKVDLVGHIVSAKKIQEKVSIKFFPNPTTGLVHFTSALSGEFEILSISGKVVAKSVLRNERALDLTFLPNGSYLIRFLGSDPWVERILINR